MNTASTGSPVRKLAHLQILRAVAASLVVIDHTFGALIDRHMPYDQYLHAGYLCGFLGVAAFFVLSGFIMVHQSTGRFGTGTGPFIFMYRRITRIVPMYWIATWLWFGSLAVWGVKLDRGWERMLLSLLFIPNYLAKNDNMSPVLGQGWTLNYEMAFYVLFALALFLPEGIGLSALILGLVGISAVGILFNFAAPSHSAYLRFYSNPLLLLFALGVLIGWLECCGKLRKLHFPVSPALLICLPVPLILLWPLMFTKSNLSSWSVWAFFFSVCVVLLCTIASSERLSAAGRVAVLLGDASYCTYLFHLWTGSWIIRWVLKGTRGLHLASGVVIIYLVGSVVAANLLGVAIHLAIERPLTKALGQVRLRRAAQAVPVA